MCTPPGLQAATLRIAYMNPHGALAPQPTAIMKAKLVKAEVQRMLDIGHAKAEVYQKLINRPRWVPPSCC